MTKLNLKRLRYLLPLILAVFCLARGLSLSGLIEQSHAAAEQTARALQRIHAVAELVSAERLATAEPEWRSSQPDLAALSQDAALGGDLFRRQLAVTEDLFQSHGSGAEAAAVRAGWFEVEGELGRRLAVNLAATGSLSISVTLLALVGCVACIFVVCQTWYAGRLRDDATLVENRLRDGEARWRAMTDTAREVLIQADPAGRILRTNHKLHASDMTWLFDSPDTWRQTVVELERSAGKPIASREVWLGGEGDGCLVEWHVFPVLDNAGRLIRIDSALLDITSWYAARQGAQARAAELEQKVAKLEQQLRDLLNQSFELAENCEAMKRAGEARMEALLNWGRRVAQPLGEATALTSRIRSGGAPLQPSDASALVGVVDSVAASLRALADFAGLERGPLELSPTRLSPRSLVEDAMETIAGRAEVRNLEVPCIVHLGVPAEVTADSRRLGEALGLVLEHAIEHTGCGEVSVRLSLASRAGSIGNLRFEVEDTGTGFTAEDLQTAFEPFHPGLAPNEVASRLAFAKRLIERMGGQMGAESEPGQGTRVWFLVPVEIPDGSESGNSSSSAELAGRRIMIVDDAASQRGALIELAQSLGLDATGCSSGSDTILKLRAAVGASTPFDFVLIDDEVSGLRGSRLVGQIAADPTLGAPALFLAVPYSLRHLVRQPASEGIRGAIAKPIRRDALERLLLGQPGAAEPESKPSEPRAATAAGSPIVLIVEDNLVNQRVAVRLVEKMGYRAAVVSNGREAIQAYLREPYDLILMDCQMPEMDGFTATAEIRRLEPPGARIPVIAMTANAMRGDRERCIAAGMDDYISKPVAFEDLRVLVTRWLARAEVARH